MYLFSFFDDKRLILTSTFVDENFLVSISGFFIKKRASISVCMYIPSIQCHWSLYFYAKIMIFFFCYSSYNLKTGVMILQEFFIVQYCYTYAVCCFLIYLFVLPYEDKNSTFISVNNCIRILISIVIHQENLLIRWPFFCVNPTYILAWKMLPFSSIFKFFLQGPEVFNHTNLSILSLKLLHYIYSIGHCHVICFPYVFFSRLYIVIGGVNLVFSFISESVYQIKSSLVDFL